MILWVVSSKYYEEEYRVTYRRDKSTNRIIQEAWRDPQGKLHREDDLPAIIRYDEFGRTIEMAWEKHNISHRDGGPQRININPENGVIYHEKWCDMGEVVRLGSKPAVTIRNPESGAVLEEHYYEPDKPIRKIKHNSSGLLSPKPII